MYKLIRYFNQNRKQIIKVILVIALIIIIIQILNYFAMEKNTKENTQKIDVSKDNNTNKEIISNKSAVSGKNVDNSKLEKHSNIIKQFMNYCNEKDIESAYNMLTDECKEVMYPTIQDFYKIYYINNFNNDTRLYTIENWINDTYEVRITENILATGKVDTESTKQDYITVIEKNEESKLNINNYIGRKEKNKETENKNVKVIITSIDTYMDYEVYNLRVENYSENTIYLDTGDDTKSIYLLDNKDVKYYFYNNELINDRLILKSNYKTNIKIKFMNTYSSNRRISNLVFSKFVFNYDEYKLIENKEEYKMLYNFKVNV